MKSYWIIASFSLMLTACGYRVAGVKSNKDMNAVQFMPKIFENIDFERVETEMCPCSPNYPHGLNGMNALKINVPKKIFFHSEDKKFIPICIAYTKSTLRELKYHNFSEKMIHIKPKSGKVVYSVKYFDKKSADKIPDISVEEIEYWQERSSELQNLSDDELNRTFVFGNILNVYYGGYLNINALDYVNLPIISGKYEIWVTYYGLESNHMIIEINLKE